MLVYMVYNKKDGKILHMHRVVDIAGRSCTCSEEEVLSLLPEDINTRTVGVLPVEIESMPSVRHASLTVDISTGKLVELPLTGTV